MVVDVVERALLTAVRAMLLPLVLPIKRRFDARFDDDDDDDAAITAASLPVVARGMPAAAAPRASGRR